jgi:hypothetical protein
VQTLVMALCVLALGGSVLAAGSKEADEERRLDEQYRQCVQACKKPVMRPETEQGAWSKNIEAESHYDNCVHHCDRMRMRGFRK